MTADSKARNIQTRHELFDFLQSQMQTAYRELQDKQRLEFESSLVKSYIFEVDLPAGLTESRNQQDRLKMFIQEVFDPVRNGSMQFTVDAKEEDGFFELDLSSRDLDLILYLDTITNPRFWIGFSISNSRLLDRWFETVAKTRSKFDFVWLWPAFLETIQKRGIPRGFGLDYDYRKFGDSDSDTTTYLKMQLWGGSDTSELYNLLKQNPQFHDKVVLSKVRLKEFGDSNKDLFALQDLKYSGKFTTRGTDFSTHVATLSFVRTEYEKKIRSIEDNYALRWRETKHGGAVLEGFAIHFIPDGFELPIQRLSERILDGTTPFRLLGFTGAQSNSSAVAEVVDLHTGGELSFEIYPDLISVYLPENTCGNTIARVYTNLQHFFNGRFTVEADNGDRIF